jgi:hypothetical protein
MKKQALGGNGQVRDQQMFVVDFNEQRVFAGLGKREIADFVDEIDAMHGTLGFKLSLEQRLEIGRVESHRDPQFVVAGRTIRDGQKPNHERMRDRKLTRLDIRKDPENRMLPRAGIDVNTVTCKPGEELRFGLHRRRRAGGWARRK